MNERSDVLERALGYPYSAPWEPFVQLRHETLDVDEIEIDRDERTAMLAYGSNAAPEVLARKLALSDQPVLVLPAWLDDFDVVYSAHISPYGAVPASLQRSPGTRVRVHLVYMTSAQVGLVSATEPNYESALLDGAVCHLDDGETIVGPAAYLSRHGCLLSDETELALSAVEATSRSLPAFSEGEVLERLRALFCPDESLETFVLANVTDPALSQVRSARLPRRPLAPA
ncbi:MAG TPA: hypothetical protein VG816_00235 [Solirubrobacterales bacterium]|nr:hypothetical protein [Solirubrobacterales bacterium]